MNVLLVIAGVLLVIFWPTIVGIILGILMVVAGLSWLGWGYRGRL